MYFSITVALAAFPFLVGAVPVHNPRDNLLSIPLSKRSMPQLSNNHRRSDKRSSNSSGDISLTNNSPLWSGTIQAGTPSKEFTVVFDTSTTDLLLFGPSCKSCQGDNIYDPSKSSTANNLTTSFNFTDSLGSIAGDVFTDSVTIGGFNISNETLVVASEVVSNLNATNFKADGVLGMAFSGQSLFDSPSVFETLVKEGQLQEPVVGMVLANSSPELIVGGRDSSRYKGDLVYTPVDTGNSTGNSTGIVGLWNTQLDGITINGNVTQVSVKDAIIDSGTSLIIGDHDSIANIYAGIPGSSRVNETAVPPSDASFQYWTYPCNTTVNASIVIGGTHFNISSDLFKLADVNTTHSGEVCAGVFAEVGAGQPDTEFWVLGDGFLQNVYTELDYGKLQIGFAQLV